MGTTKIDKAISDSYGKYFIEIQMDGTQQYIVWGPDSTDDNQDKILIGANNEVLLFQTVPESLQYILTTLAILFDEKNLKEWARAYSHHEASSSYIYNLDFLETIIHTDQFFDIANSKRKDCLYMLDFINLISDYAHQINDRYSLAIYKGEYVGAFLDFTYDNYFWTIPKEELSVRQDFKLWKDNYSKFKLAVLDLLNTFKSHCIVYTP